MPPPELIENRLTLEALSDENVEEMLTRLLPSLTRIGPKSAEMLVASLSNRMDVILNSPQYLDFLAVLVQMLEVLAAKASIASLIPLLLNPLIFNASEVVFLYGGIMSGENTLRNAIFKLVATHEFEELAALFVRCSLNPVMFAELLLRATHCHPLHNDFFGREDVMSALIEAALSIQEPICNAIGVRLSYAKSILFKTLFGILDDPDTTRLCFESQVFATGFLSLMFEPHFTDVVVQSLSRCLSHIPTVPESVPLFLLSVFESCSLHHDDKELAKIGRDLSQAIVRSLSHNTALSGYFDQVADAALSFLQFEPTAEMLDDILTILMLITQSQTTHTLTRKRLNMLLKIITAVEKNEPSDSTFLKLKNIMNASTNISMNFPFLIKAPSILPVVLLSFAKSSRLALVLDLFMSLCRHSLSNVSALHEGEVDYLLLRGVKGKFEYRGCRVRFNFAFDSTSFIREHVMPLIALIVSEHSSYPIDHVFCELIAPGERGNFSKTAELGFETLQMIFAHTKLNPPLQLPVIAPGPIVRFDNVDGTRFFDGFVLGFYTKIDSVKTGTMPHKFILFQIQDSAHIFMLRHRQGGLHAMYEGDGTRTSCALVKNFPVQNWTYIIISIQFLDDVWLLSIDYTEKMHEDIEFRRMIFSNPCTVSLGSTPGHILPVSQTPPVTLGPFAVLQLPLSAEDAERINHGLDEMCSPAAVIVSSTIPEMVIDRTLVRSDLSGFSSMQFHYSVDDFIPIFVNIQSAPPAFAALAVETMVHLVDFARVVVNDQIHRADHSASLVELLGIDVPAPDPPERLSLTKVSAIPVLVLRQARDLCTYQLYLSFFKLLESVRERWLAREIFQHILLNVWLWASTDDTTFQRVLKHWPLMLSRTGHLHGGVFKAFLTQTHLLLHASRREFPELSTARFRLLEQLALALAPLDAFDTAAVCAMVHAVRKDEAAVLAYIQFLSTLVSLDSRAFDADCVFALIALTGVPTAAIFRALAALIAALAQLGAQAELSQLALEYFAHPGADATVCPASGDLACIRAIFERPPEFDFAPSGEFWFFWPVIVGLVHGADAADALLPRIVADATVCHDVLDLLELFESVGVAAAAELRDRYLAALLAVPQPERIVVRAFIALHFRFKPGPFSDGFVALAQTFDVDRAFLVDSRAEPAPIDPAHLRSFAPLARIGPSWRLYTRKKHRLCGFRPSRPPPTCFATSRSSSQTRGCRWLSACWSVSRPTWSLTPSAVSSSPSRSQLHFSRNETRLPPRPRFTRGWSAASDRTSTFSWRTGSRN
jgi:hypothetical protein